MWLRAEMQGLGGGVCTSAHVQLPVTHTLRSRVVSNRARRSNILPKFLAEPRTLPLHFPVFLLCVTLSFSLFPPDVAAETGMVQVRNASKKAGGSSRNGRKTAGRRLGVKVHDGAAATAGNIIIRQRGAAVHPGLNVGMGKDHTLFALTDGIVKMKTRVITDCGKRRKYAHVLATKQDEHDFAYLVAEASAASASTAL